MRSRRYRDLRTAIAGIFLLTCLILIHTGPQPSTLAAAFYRNKYSALNPDPCDGWDMYKGEKHDPPGCLRAQQLREIQKFRQTEFAETLDSLNLRQLEYLERCVLGMQECPERPLIVVDYHWAHRAEREEWFQGGEGVWSRVILEAMRRLGFAVISTGGGEGAHKKTWPMLRDLGSSVHAYYAEPGQCFRCLNSPACVRPEDYHEPKNPEHQITPDKAIGSIPAWRVFSFGFWGSRPRKYSASAQVAAGAGAESWGMGLKDEEEDWSHHALGHKWEVVPYAFPGHSHIPMSIEQRCLASPPAPAEDRKRAVLILSKEASNFHLGRLKGRLDWHSVVAHAKMAAIELWTVVKDPKPDEVPEGIVSLGELSKLEYTSKVGSVRAMLGIGAPELSPSPYEALCRGTPVVLPYHEFPDPHGWYEFSEPWFQHGPATKIGPPYVYSYNYTDADDLVAKLKLALSTPIEPYIHPGMTVAEIRITTANLLLHDWEKEYETVKEQNGGQMPRYPQRMLDQCFSGIEVCIKMAG